jgi:hypothetical protein
MRKLGHGVLGAKKFQMTNFPDPDVSKDQGKYCGKIFSLVNFIGGKYLCTDIFIYINFTKYQTALALLSRCKQHTFPPFNTIEK